MVSCKSCLAVLAAVVGTIGYFLFPAAPFDPASVRGQHVLVTGASTGIGEQLAYAYAKLGANLIITARREAVLRDVAAKCLKLGAQDVRVVAADMSSDSDRKRLMDDVRQHGGRLDQIVLNHVLINTHGFWLGSPENMTGLRKDWETNFVAYVDLASQALPMLAASGGGRIGVVSSMAGKVGVPKLASYSANKFAMQGFFSALRHELHHRRMGVSVTLCVLGMIGTENARAFSASQGAISRWSSVADPAETATAILEAVTTGVREMRYPFQQTFILSALSVFPDVIETQIARLMLSSS